MVERGPHAGVRPRIGEPRVGLDEYWPLTSCPPPPHLSEEMPSRGGIEQTGQQGGRGGDKM